VAHRPTKSSRRRVAELAGFGLRPAQIGLVLSDEQTLCEKTIRNHYAAELSTGRARMAEKMARNLTQLAFSEDPGALTAMIFWLKCQAQWRTTDTKISVHAEATATATAEGRSQKEIREFAKEFEAARLRATKGSGSAIV
jgi:hypothetical protein